MIGMRRCLASSASQHLPLALVWARWHSTRTEAAAAQPSPQPRSLLSPSPPSTATSDVTQAFLSGSEPTSVQQGMRQPAGETRSGTARKRGKNGRKERGRAAATAIPMNQTEGSLSSGKGALTGATSAPLPPPRTTMNIPTAYKSFREVLSLSAVKTQYGDLENGSKSDAIIRVGGRLVSVRDMGRILFLTIRGDGQELQLVRQANDSFPKSELKKLRESLRAGDIVGAVGHPGRTLKGELSLYCDEVRILTPYVCADQVICPNLRGFAPIEDAEVKYRYRFVDMMTDPAVQTHFRKRHAATKALRVYLDDHDFVEVETPMLHQVASGANARPFATHHNANDADLFLRVAPELHLKQCVVGGMDRVYEIGRVFRNEDADRSHNPEFTSCEFYAAYHTYEDLIPITESILRVMARAANGSTTVTVSSCVDGQAVELDLAKPFRRVSVYEEIQRVAEVELPPPNELNTPRGLAYMSAIMLRYNIPLPPVRTAAKMFDKLIDFFITDRVVEPTFVMDHPLFMSPLAKEHDDRRGLSERFELFINGTEYCNAYSELNDPQEQYFRFQQQMIDKQTGDDEAMTLDETFLKALQMGLPPTAGWGMGIDRVVMLLNGSNTIRDEIIFPLLRQDAVSHDAKRRRKTASSFGFNCQMTLFCLNALEDEMIKHSAPTDSMEKVRELRRCIITKGTHGNCTATFGSLVLDSGGDGKPALTGWRFDAAMAVLRIICGTANN